MWKESKIQGLELNLKNEVADLGFEFESFVNDAFNKRRGFDFGPKSPGYAYINFLDFLLEMQGKLQPL